jgi:hypothetical protein
LGVSILTTILSITITIILPTLFTIAILLHLHPRPLLLVLLITPLLLIVVVDSNDIHLLVALFSHLYHGLYIPTSSTIRLFTLLCCRFAPLSFTHFAALGRRLLAALGRRLFVFFLADGLIDHLMHTTTGCRCRCGR